MNSPRSNLGRGRWVFLALSLIGSPLLAHCSSELGISPTESVEPRRASLGAFNVLTRSYDNQRTSANLNETLLNQGNVNLRQFGKLFQLPVDDEVYAQILYASGVSIDGATHNVVYVATVNNTVYAFDADTPGAPLWQRNFNGAGRPPRNYEVANGTACNRYYRDFAGNIGIVGTPVIDAASGTLFFVTRTLESEQMRYYLRAVSIASGAERAGSPKLITASVPGTGDGSDGVNVSFDAMYHNQRAGLALGTKTVYVTFASYCDERPYHGWIMGYDAATLAQTAVLNTTPDTSLGGIWQAGAAPAIDSNGYVYVTTGNGEYDGTSSFGETLLKLHPTTLSPTSWFTPSNFSTLNLRDDDFGSAGPSFLPGTNWLVNGGKEGKVYLANSNDLGGMVEGDVQIQQSLQAVDTAARPGNSHHIHNQTVLWQSPAGLNMYVWGENDYLRSYRFNASTQRFTTPAARVGAVLPPPGMPGGSLTLSANGSRPGTGILWATTPSQGDANHGSVPAVLRAFNAETLDLLWESTSPGDDVLALSKGSQPVVAQGKVYVASISGVVSVFGARTGPTPPITNAIYQIRTLTAPDKCVDIAGGSASSAANVQQYACNGTNAQRFQFTNIANDVYEIRNINSNKCLDVAGGGSRDGANVQQYTCNGTSAQRWAVRALGNGQYRLMPQTANDRCLDIDNAAPANGTNIQQWTCNRSVAQVFQLAFDSTGPQPIPNGTYRISPGTGLGRCLDIAGGSTSDAGNVQQWECNGTDAQRFRFRSLGGTSYEVRASVSEMCVEVAYSGTWNGANIHQWPCSGTAAQIWSVEALGAGRYRFVPQLTSGKCMDVSGGSGSNGANVQQWSCNATAAQSFAVLAP